MATATARPPVLFSPACERNKQPICELLRQWLPQANAQQLEEIEAINAELPFTAPPPPLGSPLEPGPFPLGNP